MSKDKHKVLHKSTYYGYVDLKNKQHKINYEYFI